jgi:hypothetical protein
MADRILRDMLLTSLRARYLTHGVRESAGRLEVATVPARHPEVGDLAITLIPPTLPAESIGVQVAMGSCLHDTFENYDTHLDLAERASRVTSDVVRFLDALFSDRLLAWVPEAGPGSGWRDHGDTAQMEPLVTDNRVYRRYVWSGPLPRWQAVPAILGRRTARDEREYEILRKFLDEGTGTDSPDRVLARELVAAYERALEDGHG